MRQAFCWIALALVLLGCAPQTSVTPAPAAPAVTQIVAVTVIAPVSQEATSVPATAAPTLQPTAEGTKIPECPSKDDVVKMLNDQLRLAGDKLKNWHPTFGAEFVQTTSGSKCIFAVTLQVHGKNERNTEIYSHAVQTSMEYLVTRATPNSNLFTFQWAKSGQLWYRQPVESLEDGALFGGFYWYIPASVH